MACGRGLHDDQRLGHHDHRGAVPARLTQALHATHAEHRDRDVSSAKNARALTATPGRYRLTCMSGYPARRAQTPAVGPSRQPNRSLVNAQASGVRTGTKRGSSVALATVDRLQITG